MSFWRAGKGGNGEGTLRVMPTTWGGSEGGGWLLPRTHPGGALHPGKVEPSVHMLWERRPCREGTEASPVPGAS